MEAPLGPQHGPLDLPIRSLFGYGRMGIAATIVHSKNCTINGVTLNGGATHSNYGDDFCRNTIEGNFKKNEHEKF